MRALMFAWVCAVALGQPLVEREIGVAGLEKQMRAAKGAGYSDAATAQLFVSTRPAARISPEELAALQAAAPGPRTRDVLDFLRLLSLFRTERPEPEPPEAAALREAAHGYAERYLRSLPDFLCTRATRHFDNQDLPGEDWRNHPELWFGLRLRTVGAQELQYVQGRERVEGQTREATQSSFGEFSGLMGDVLAGAERPRLGWLRWETVGGERLGVFRFEVPVEQSRYVIRHSLGPGKGEEKMTAAYRGEVAVASSGAIVRLTRETMRLPKSFPTKSVKTVIEYAPVRVDPQGLLFPVRSQTVSEVEQVAPQGYILEFRFLNDSRFVRYRKFGAAARLVGEDESAAAAEEPESEPEPWIDPMPVESATEPAPQAALTLKTTTRLVEVPVSVYDGKGQAVRDLKAEDFRLYDNGQERKFTLLAELGAAAATAGTARAAGPAVAGAPAVVTNESRGAAAPLTVLVIRRDEVPWGDLAMARAAMVKFLKTLPAGAQVPVFVMEGREVLPLRDLESDWLALLRPGSKREEKKERTSGPGDDDQGLEAHTRLARFLGAIPGPKRMLFVSAGKAQDAFTSQPAGMESFETKGRNRDEAPRRIGQMYNDANVSVYAIDPRGLTVTRADASIGLDAAGSPIGPDTRDLQPVEDMQSMHQGQTRSAATGQVPTPQQRAMGVINGTHTDRLNAMQSSLVQLAEDTGGKALLNTNDLGRALRTAYEDAPGHYRLGFYAPAVEKAGRFHRLRVKAPERPELRLRYRRGYLEEERAPTPEARMLAAAESPLNWDELKLEAEVSASKPGQVLVRLKVGAGEVPFRVERGRRAAQLEVHYIQKDRHGAELDRVVDKVSLAGSLGRLEEWRRDGIRVEHGLRRDAQLARLTVVVRSLADGRIGTLQLEPPGAAQSTASTR